LSHPSIRNLNKKIPLPPIPATELRNYDDVSSSSSSSSDDEEKGRPEKKKKKTKKATPNPNLSVVVHATSGHSMRDVLDRALSATSGSISSHNLNVIPISKASTEHRSYDHITFPASLEELKNITPAVHHYFVCIMFWFFFLLVVGLMGLGLTIVSGILLYRNRVPGQSIPFWWWFSIGHTDVSLRVWYTAYLVVAIVGSIVWIVVYVWYLHNRNTGPLSPSGNTGADGRSSALDLVRQNTNQKKKTEKLHRAASLKNVNPPTSFPHHSLSPPSSLASPSSSSYASAGRSLSVPTSPGAAGAGAAASASTTVNNVLERTLSQKRIEYRRRKFRLWGVRLLGVALFFVLLGAQIGINYEIQQLVPSIGPFWVAALLSLTLSLLNFAWQWLSTELTRAEHHSLMADFNNSLAFKTFSFRLASTVVLVSVTHNLLENNVGGANRACAYDILSQQYVVALGTETLVSFFVGIVMSFVQKRVLWLCCRKSHHGDNVHNPEFSFVEEYDDLIRKLQLVIVALPVTPLMPLGMAIVMFFEYLFDQYKLLRICKPVYHMQAKFHWTVGLMLFVNTIVSISVPSGSILVVREWWRLEGTLCS